MQVHASGRARTNLPARMPPLFGRNDDVAAVRSLLAKHAVVTIVGAGGIGKTRVAQAAGAAALADFPDGVWWIELAALADGALVPASVLRPLGIPLGGDRDPTEAVVSVIRSQRLLLILDNCEHLLDAVSAFVDAIRAAAPDVRVLVTSQELLRTSEEHVYRLGTLPLPAHADAAAAAASGAVALFVARAQAVDPRFELNDANAAAVIDVCRRLDGIPLAIELAAARLPLLGIAGLRERLNERFKVLTAGARVVLRRHQTLRAALEWSHGLLTPDEQTVFRRLGVFAGSFTLESAQQVAADGHIDAWAALDHLGALVDKSLVLVEGDPVPRYRLLETTRVYALERLAETGETEQVLRRHAETLVRWLAAFLRARTRRRLDESEETMLAPELDNVRTAFDWAAAGDDDELALALAGASWIVWAYGNVGDEGWRRCVALRSRVKPDTPPRVEAAFWNAITSLGAVAAKRETYDAALREVELLRGLGDDQLLYIALQRLAAIGARRGELRPVEQAIDEALRLERPDWPPRQRANLQWAIHRWLAMQGRYEEAMACAMKQAALYLEEGADENQQQALGANVADCEIGLGRLEAAEARCRAALALRTPGAAGWGHVHDALMVALTLQGRHDEAIEQGRLAQDDLRRQGDETRLLETLALNAAMQGRVAEAATIAGFVDAEFARTGEVRWPPTAERRARLDALLAAGLAPADRARRQQAGARMTGEQAFALAFGDAAAID